MNEKPGGVKVSRLADRGALLVALLLAVLLVVVSGGVASATAPYLLTPTPVPTTEPAQAGDGATTGAELGEEVRLDKAGFAFSPPAGWQVVDMEEDETAGMVLVAPVAEMAETDLLVIGLGPAGEVDQQADTLPELAEAVVTSFDDDQVDISEAQEISFNGFEALAYDITGANETGLEMAGRLAISLVDADRAFIFMAISTLENWNEDQIQAVFDSVRLFAPVAGEGLAEPAAEPAVAAPLGQQVTETVGDASLSLAAPEGWEIIRQDDIFGSRIDLTLLPAAATAAPAPGMRLVLDLDRSGLAGEVTSLEALVSGIVPSRQAAAMAEGAEITAAAPEAIEVSGVAGVRVNWEKTGAEGITQGMLVLALLEGAAGPIFIFEASAPAGEWDSGLAAAVLDSVSFEGAAPARRFTLKNDGLSFTAPAGWYAEARGLEQGRVFSVSPGQDTYLPGFFIGVFSPGFGTGDEAVLLAELVSGALLPDASGALLEVSEGEAIEVNGLAATDYALSGTAGEADQAGRLIVAALEDGRSLVIAGAAPAENLEMEHVFQSFVDSVTLAE